MSEHEENEIIRELIEQGNLTRYTILQAADAIVNALAALAPQRATKLVLHYTLKGETMGASVTAVVGQVYNPSVVESNATTPNIPPIGPLVFATDNAAAVAVDAAGVATMIGSGSANVSVLDQGNGLTDTTAFSVAAPPPPVADKLTLDYKLA